MKKARLRFEDGSEIAIDEQIVTIGRASDNKIRIQDTNVSRYHAEIEFRDGEFWFTDLKSSNGSFLNDSPVTSSVRLQHGDRINFGGTIEAEFCLEAQESTEKVEEPKDSKTNISTLDAKEAASSTSLNSAQDALSSSDSADKKSKLLPILIISLALFFLVGIVLTLLYLLKPTPQCQAKVAIISPENGDTISKETEISLDVENADCISRIVLVLDKKEIASLEENPFSTKLNPSDFPELADGVEHPLQVFVEDKEGKRALADTVSLAFETAALPTPSPTTEDTENIETTDTQASSSSSQQKISLAETQQLLQKQLKQFSGNLTYRFDPQFIEEVRRRTAEYAKEEGFFERASTYRDLINIEFYKENGLDAPIGFLLAMSRSKFKPQKQGKLEGLWQISDELVTTSGYKNLCPNESLSDSSQSCAAKTAAVYTKALVLKIFNGDIIYAVAAFGMSEQEASLWASTLPQNKENFWQIIKNPQQRENVARFFAAAIVAENPQKFGLKRDKPLSELYRNLLKNP